MTYDFFSEDRINTRPCCICLAGLPRSGKSTLARFLWEKRGIVPINGDDYRRAIHDKRYDAALDQDVHRWVAQTAQTLLNRGVSVSVEGTFLTREIRCKFESGLGWLEPLWVWCIPPDNHEDLLRLSEFPMDVIVKMIDDMEMPAFHPRVIVVGDALTAGNLLT